MTITFSSRSRTLLGLAITLACAILITAYFWNKEKPRIEARNSTANWITSHGGTVIFPHARAPKDAISAFWRRCTEQVRQVIDDNDRFQTVIHVTISTVESEARLDYKHVIETERAVSGTETGDPLQGVTSAIAQPRDISRAISRLDCFPDLISVWLMGRGIDDDALSFLPQLRNLRHLRVHRTNTSSIASKHIAKLDRLTHLAIEGTGIDNTDAESLSRLVELEVLTCPNGGDHEGKWRLFQRKIDDAGVKLLGKLDRLQRLDLAGAEITSEALLSIAHLKSLTHLNISFNRVSDDHLELLAQLPHLKRLELAGTQIGDQGFAKLSQSVSLENIDLSSTLITDASMSSARTMRSLRYLGVNSTKVSDAARQDLITHLLASTPRK